MSVEELEDALVTLVALTKSVLVKAVNLGVSHIVCNCFQIFNEQVALSELPREMRQGLSQITLINFPAVAPQCVVVLLGDEVFNQSIFKSMIEELIDGSFEIHSVQSFIIIYLEDLLIHLPGDVFTDQHGFKLELQVGRVVVLWTTIFGHSSNHDLLQLFIIEEVHIVQRTFPNE